MLREKNDVQMTFDDFYKLYVNQIDLFKSGFGLVFTNLTTLVQNFFSETCTLREKMMYK